MANIDLHMHSTHSSDGEFTPTQLAAMSKAAGLTHAALADHNSVKGIAEIIAASNGTGVTFIPAIEMDCVIDSVNLHLLGYGIDHASPIFNVIESNIHKQEKENSTELIRLVRQHGIEFSDEIIKSLAYDEVVTGEMIAEAALMHDTECKNPLLDPYRGSGVRSDNAYVNFYWDFCSQGKPAYVPMQYMDLKQAIQIIESNGGVTILAHPGINVKEDSLLLKKIIATGVQGIEVYSSYHNPEQLAFYKHFATTHGLLMTCGSDFHGKTKKSIKIGSTDCDGLENQIIASLMQAMKSVSN